MVVVGLVVVAVTVAGIGARVAWCEAACAVCVRGVEREVSGGGNGVRSARRVLVEFANAMKQARAQAQEPQKLTHLFETKGFEPFQCKGV